MRKIGTISSSAGLIFLGVWMIISKTNPTLGAEVFKWWPAVIVLLGLEVLLQITRKEGEKTSINFLIIPVLLILLCVNVFNGVRNNFGGFFRNIDFGNVPEISFDGFDGGNYKAMQTTKILEAKGKELIISMDNGKINIYPATDGKIKIEGDVYVKDSYDIDKYEIIEDATDAGYRINLSDGTISKVALDVYIPDGYNLKLEGDNLNIKGDEAFTKSSIDFKGDNINVNLNGAASSNIDYNNGNINLNNVKEITANGDNANLNIDGDAEKIYITADNGRVNINNNICSDINIETGQGVVKLITKDDNVKVDVELDQGVTEINDSKFVNTGSSETFGTGAGKVKIKMDQGAVKFIN